MNTPDAWAAFWAEVDAIEADHDAGVADRERRPLSAKEEALLAELWERDQANRPPGRAGGIPGGSMPVGQPAPSPILIRPLAEPEKLPPEEADTLAGWCRILRRAVRRAGALCHLAPMRLDDTEIETDEERSLRWAGRPSAGSRKAPAWALRAWACSTSAHDIGTSPNEWKRMAGIRNRVAREWRKLGVPEAALPAPLGIAKAHGVEGAFWVAWEMVKDFTEGRPDLSPRGRAILANRKLPSR